MEDGGGSSREDGSLSAAACGDGLSSSWTPRLGAFSRYTPPSSLPEFPSIAPRAIVKRPLVVRLTKDIVETFQICNPNFKYSEALNPKRFLTSPSVGTLNNGHDNANSDLILHVNLVLVNTESKQRYVVKDVLGQGSFGQVAKCWVEETNSYVAVKVIKNQPAYYQQALIEVSILYTLNQKFDPEDKHHIVRVFDYFIYQHHLCISFEMLGSNLYELIKTNHFKGLALSIVREFSKQILHALVVMKDASIIHCDLKPENILICTSMKPAGIKIIDFGSACMENRTVYSYIQSRYYRSPEVLLGCPYTAAIDMWSVGCVVAELFLGLPLFPGASEYDVLKRIIKITGAQPPDDLLRDAKNTGKFFKYVGSIYCLEDNEGFRGINSAYRLLTEDECEAKELKRPAIGKHYFNHASLEDIIAKYPYRKSFSEEEISREKHFRLALVDLLKGLLEVDPRKRWSPLQALRHPFVTGEPFSCPYKPPSETPRIPVNRAVTVNHNPGGGHWLATGLSPQVSNANRYHPHNNSQFQMMPLSHGGSYGSMGSHGSYNDNAGLGSSYGSYGDRGSIYTYYSPAGPSGMNMHAQVGPSILGASPDARCRPQLFHGNGFGASPTGSLGPMSLGASPSQYTPTSSQMQYGPTSPARGSVHGSPLGKATAVGQYNRRRNWGYPMQSHESTPQHWQGHHSDDVSCSHPDAYSRGHIGSPRSTLPNPNICSLRQQTSGGLGSSAVATPGNHQNFPGTHAINSNVVVLRSAEASRDKSECISSVPDPADWDPCYSEELLLEEDTSEGRPTFGVSNSMYSGNASNAAILTSEVGRLSLGSNNASSSTNVTLSNHRADGLLPSYSMSDGSPPAHDMRSGHNRLPYYPQNSTSRFRQQSFQGNHMFGTSIRGEQNHHRGQPGRSTYYMRETHSSGTGVFGNGLSWGRRVGHTVANIVPSPHERKDSGRI